MLEIGDFFGINTDLRIDPNSIPNTDLSAFVDTRIFCHRRLTLCGVFNGVLFKFQLIEKEYENHPIQMPVFLQVVV